MIQFCKDVFASLRTYAFPLKVPYPPDKGGSRGVDLEGLKDRNYRFLRLNVRYLCNLRPSYKSIKRRTWKLQHALTTEQIDFYQKNGFLVIENFLDADELEEWQTMHG